MQTGVDHIILGINDLERGIAFIEQRTGVRAAAGGVHPGRGTRNALLTLGPDRYLEIIAPDPAQSTPTWFTSILRMTEPRLVGWAVHTPDLNALARIAVTAGIAIDGPHDGARSRPDGRLLRWKLFRLRKDEGGLLPFFIEWGRDSIHPALDAPSGCELGSLQVQSPDPVSLMNTCQTLGIPITIEPHAHPRILARITGPKHQLVLTS